MKECMATHGSVDLRTGTNLSDSNNVLQSDLFETPIRQNFDRSKINDQPERPHLDFPAKTLVFASVMAVDMAAEYLGLSVSTLNKWRCYGEGPKFIKMGRAIRYRLSDLDKYIESRQSSSTSEYNF